MDINKLYSWLKQLGIPGKSLTKRGNRLEVSLVTDNGKRYKVFFEIEDDNITFESPVFRTINGRIDAVRDFQTILLTYNGKLISPLSFGFIQVKGNKWYVSLKGIQHISSVTPHYLVGIIQWFDAIYSEEIPKLKDLAIELDLKFDGKISISDFFSSFFN